MLRYAQKPIYEQLLLSMCMSKSVHQKLQIPSQFSTCLWYSLGIDNILSRYSMPIVYSITCFERPPLIPSNCGLPREVFSHWRCYCIKFNRTVSGKDGLKNISLVRVVYQNMFYCAFPVTLRTYEDVGHVH